MQRRIVILAVLLVLQLAAAIALAMRQDRLAPAQPDTPLIAVDLKPADRLNVDGPLEQDKGKDAAKVELVKRAGQWVLPGYFDAPADAAKVDSMLDRLSHLKRGLPIATSKSAPERFEVAEDKYQRRVVVSAGSNALATLYLGQSSGLRKASARTATDKAVYSVAIAPYDLPADAAGWMDTELLSRARAQPVQISLAADGHAPLVLEKKAKGTQGSPDWQLTQPVPGKRLDEKQAVNLASVIEHMKVDVILGTEAKPEWQQEPPALVLTLTGQDGKAVTWTLTKPSKDDFYVLKASDHPWYFQLKSWNARPLIDAAAVDKLMVAADDTHAGGAAAATAAQLPQPAAQGAQPAAQSSGRRTK